MAKPHTLKNFFKNKYKSLNIPAPKAHFVLGSLMGPVFSTMKLQIQKQSLKRSALINWAFKGRVLFKDTPDLTPPTAPSHLGAYEYFIHKQKGHSICFQSGRLHGYEGLAPKSIAGTVTGPAQAGSKVFVLCNISGSLKKAWPPGSIVAVRDHINLTAKTPLTGPHFLDMTHLYNQKLSKSIGRFLKKTYSGVYACMPGPQLETPAEIKMLSIMGADVVGMSTVWEAIALHHLGIKVSCFSVVSNLAAGVGKSVHIHAPKLNPSFEQLLKAFFKFSESNLL